MSLVTRLAPEVSTDARAEGERLLAAGGARIDLHEPGWIEATVRQNTRPYPVYLSREKGVVRYSCDCNDYRTTLDPCRHVWAALLKAQQQGYLDEWDTTRQLDFLPEDDDF